MMRVAVEPIIPTDLFQLEEWREARTKACASHGCVYTWKTQGESNWLERGLSQTDSLGLVILPRGLPDVMDMPDDPATGQ